MITITRRQARCLRGVFRRAPLGITHRGPVPPLWLHAGGGQLRASYRYAGLALEHAETGPDGDAETIAVPLDALADVEGRDGSAVVLEALAPGRTAARWDDRGIPQIKAYVVPQVDPSDAFPEPPPIVTEVPTGLLDALAEAAATTTEGTTRYALNSILLRGASGEVVATDGRQLLIQGGFRFPWDGEVLVEPSPVFACKALPREVPVLVGKTETQVVLAAGPWTLALRVRAGARFPRVEHVVPDLTAATSRLRLGNGDAAFLARTLDRLPGGDAANAPVTLNLNGQVAVRARDTSQGPITELVLSRSASTGVPVGVSANRAFLARAVRLGFAGVDVVDADSPIVCRDGPRIYCFQPLSKESAIGPGGDVARIESCPSELTPADTPGATTKAESALSVGTDRDQSRPGDGEFPGGSDRGNDTAAPGPIGGHGLAALILEAKGLHAALGEAKARAGRLTVALRRHRKRDRLVGTTPASLRALKLGEVSG